MERGEMSLCVIGVGFRKEATAASIADAIALALAALGDAAIPHAIATPDDKAGAAALRETAAKLALAIIPISADALARAAPDTHTHSATVAAHRGVGSVSEAAAIAGAGLAARLAVSRVVSRDRMATSAIAIGADQTNEERS
jgi:cobalt-precorrin 5A hydrolase